MLRCKGSKVPTNITAWRTVKRNQQLPIIWRKLKNCLIFLQTSAMLKSNIELTTPVMQRLLSNVYNPPNSLQTPTNNEAMRFVCRQKRPARRKAAACRLQAPTKTCSKSKETEVSDLRPDPPKSLPSLLYSLLPLQTRDRINRTPQILKVLYAL